MGENMEKKIAVDFFKDPLEVNKDYVFMLRSGGYYQAIAKVVSIEYEVSKEYNRQTRKSKDRLTPVVKVMRNGEIYKYDYATGKSHYEPYTYIKRIYNWESAIPVPEGK
jgi:hypothetical protein